MRRSVFLAFTLVAVASGCGTRVIIKSGGPPPAWVDKQPNHPGLVCAVGYSGPTFYQQDCFKNAAENARSHLAESIAVTIKTVTLDISDGSRGYFSRETFVEGSESASEVVLTGAEVLAQWMDVEGVRGSPKGCYAWVCIDPQKPLDKLLDRLEEKKVPPKTIQKVRENAEAAFRELEQAEQKQRYKPLLPQTVPAPNGKPVKTPAEQQDDAAGRQPAAPAGVEDAGTKTGPEPAVRKINLQTPDSNGSNQQTPGGD